MTFEELQKANELIRTTDIKGKAYAEVNERIKAFRSVYPNGFIITELLSDIDGVCKIQAKVGYYEDKEPFVLATGTAYEKEGSTFINKTSYLENCETSAVGRALGNAGFGIDTSVASYEEVSNAIAQQEDEKKKTAKITKQQLLTIETLLEECNQERPENLNNWSQKKADEAIKKLMSMRNAK